MISCEQCAFYERIPFLTVSYPLDICGVAFYEGFTHPLGET